MDNIITGSKNGWYCIKFNTVQESQSTASDFSKQMNLFLKEIENFNQAIFSDTTEGYNVESYIESLEAGSFKLWLGDKLSKIEDKHIDNFVSQPLQVIISAILKKSRDVAIEALSDEQGNSYIVKDPSYIKEYQSKIEKDIIYKISTSINETISEVISEVIDDIEIRKLSKEEMNFLKNIMSNANYEKIIEALIKMSRIAKKTNCKISYINDYGSDKESVINGNFYDLYKRAIPNKTMPSNITIKDLVIHSPELKENARIWVFEMDGKNIKVDISSTDIAQQAIERGEVRVGDTYTVELSETRDRSYTGSYKTSYKILKVIELTRH